ncbi:transcriptional adapter ada2a [Quercus suber]|uniref:Transcriptional adapter ada2a n=1 Tax=Quercus suber TaxID=58331 RepID=A0AAW0LFZ5_QUESU
MCFRCGRSESFADGFSALMLGAYDWIDLGPCSEVSKGIGSTDDLLENSLETEEQALGVEEAKALPMFSQLSLVIRDDQTEARSNSHLPNSELVLCMLKSDESKGPAWQSSSSLTSVMIDKSINIFGTETGKGLGSNSGNTFSGVIKKASNSSQIKDGIKMEEFQSDRSIGEKKPRVPGDEGPSMTELSGYNFKRQEFEIEYDNDAEQILADMEFKNTDSAADRKLKLRVLRIYSKRLDERKRRKDFILERNLLYPNPLEKSLLPKEREICQCYKVFMQFHSKEEHDELLKNIIEEQQIVKRIQDLQGARAAGY